MRDVVFSQVIKMAEQGKDPREIITDFNDLSRRQFFDLIITYVKSSKPEKEKK